MRTCRSLPLYIMLLIFAILAVVSVQSMQYVEKAKQTNARIRSGQVVELTGRIITIDEAMVLSEVDDTEIVPTDVNLYPDEHLSIPSGHLSFGQVVYILQFDKDNAATLVVSMLDNKIGWVPNNFVILND